METKQWRGWGAAQSRTPEEWKKKLDHRLAFLHHPKKPRTERNERKSNYNLLCDDVVLWRPAGYCQMRLSVSRISRRIYPYFQSLPDKHRMALCRLKIYRTGRLLRIGRRTGTSRRPSSCSWNVNSVYKYDYSIADVSAWADVSKSPVLIKLLWAINEQKAEF